MGTSTTEVVVVGMAIAAGRLSVVGLVRREAATSLLAARRREAIASLAVVDVAAGAEAVVGSEVEAAIEAIEGVAGVAVVVTGEVLVPVPVPVLALVLLLGLREVLRRLRPQAGASLSGMEPSRSGRVSVGAVDRTRVSRTEKRRTRISRTTRCRTGTRGRWSRRRKSGRAPPLESLPDTTDSQEVALDCIRAAPRLGEASIGSR